MLLLTREEKLVIIGLAVVLLAGTCLQYGIKKFPRLRFDTDFLESRSMGRRLNINTASREQLVALPYIGEVTAKRILDYRRDKGHFQKIDELNNIPGIGPRLYERLTPYIRVD